MSSIIFDPKGDFHLLEQIAQQMLKGIFSPNSIKSDFLAKVKVSLDEIEKVVLNVLHTQEKSIGITFKEDAPGVVLANNTSTKVFTNYYTNQSAPVVLFMYETTLYDERKENLSIELIERKKEDNLEEKEYAICLAVSHPLDNTLLEFNTNTYFSRNFIVESEMFNLLEFEKFLTDSFKELGSLLELVLQP